MLTLNLTLSDENGYNTKLIGTLVIENVRSTDLTVSYAYMGLFKDSQKETFFKVSGWLPGLARQSHLTENLSHILSAINAGIKNGKPHCFKGYPGDTCKLITQLEDELAVALKKAT